jgi:hypothetical protein
MCEVLSLILFTRQSNGNIAPMKVFEGDELRGMTFKTEKSFIVKLRMMKFMRGDQNRLSGQVVLGESKAFCLLELNNI